MNTADVAVQHETQKSGIGGYHVTQVPVQQSAITSLSQLKQGGQNLVQLVRFVFHSRFASQIPLHANQVIDMDQNVVKVEETKSVSINIAHSDEVFNKSDPLDR